MQIHSGNQTSQGRVRNSNEDSYVINPGMGLFLVADGMGGHAAGEIASHLAASTLNEWVMAHTGEEPAAEVIHAGAQEANTRVFDAQAQDRTLAGMGSTLTALLIRDPRYYVAHVGDSRAYQLRDGVLEQLTEDHSLVWHLYESGVLTKSDLARHPQKNLITRSIGSHPHVEIDVMEGEARAGDVYLLCSDGLTDAVSDEQISAALSTDRKSPQEIADLLVDTANRAGGPDNITVVVVRLTA
jgi:protein phosphatase